jgi:DNA-3-methyladenine glycosylase II
MKPIVQTSATAQRMTVNDYARARRHLMRRDPELGEIIRRVGACRLQAYRDGDLFSALVETIVSQQLSTRVADVIFGRVCALCGTGASPSPGAMLALTIDQLRAAGLSTPKARYVHGLATAVAEGELSLDTLEHLPDDEVIASLSTIKGIGRWSAQMILLFRLNRPDVWPTGDLGIVRALERHHGLRKTPSIARLERLGDRWRPYRSIAAWYLWQSLGS